MPELAKGAASSADRGKTRLQPPGTLLQRMYLRERIAGLRPGTFIEVGVGDGSLSKLLLDAGWSGAGYELSPRAAATAADVLEREIADGRYELVTGDWLQVGGDGPQVDLLISSLVVEHLDDSDEARYLSLAAAALNQHGVAIMFVPGSPDHWGVEDEIAGHHRRYTQRSMRARLEDLGWQATHLAGLTFPLSNVLLPLSNRFVDRAERHKRQLTMQERTTQSGHRAVPGKTMFPAVAAALLNERAMRPLHWLQKRYRHREDALILYVEARPLRRNTAT